MIKFFRITSAILLILFNIAYAQTGGIKNAAELQLALDKLNVLGSVLYIGAHPDDENTGLLAYLSKAGKYRTAYLSLTRGDGGQNLIGSEKGIEIGIIRTQELLEARKIDGGEQFFTRAIDFGFSKSSDESLDIWGRDSVLSDVIWVIRKFRPDVIITRFPPDGNGGHGHHTASARLAKEAFIAAAKPEIFPEQLRYVKPWQAKRILWNSYRPGENEIKGLIGVDIGEYNPLLGKSYTEIAAESRSMHKSQGFGSSPNRGTRKEYFQFIAGEPVISDIFEGVNTKWNRISNGERTGEIITEVANSFLLNDPSKSLNSLIEIYREIDKLENNEWIMVKKQELLEIIKYSAGLWMEAVAADYSAAPGDKISVKISVINRGSFDFKIDKIEFPTIHSNSIVNTPLIRNQPFTKESIINLPDEYPISQPYWLQEEPSHGLFKVAGQIKIGKSENSPSVPVNISVTYNDEVLTYTIPVIYKWNDRVEGELTKPFNIYPPVTANMAERVSVFSNDQGRELQLTLKNISPDISGEIHLYAKGNWRITPEVIPFSFIKKYGEQTYNILVTPPKQADETFLKAEIKINNNIYSKAFVEITYPHIEQQVYFQDSQTKLVKINLKKTDAKIGYIMGSGDEIPVYLENLGYDVKIISDIMLERMDLSQFDAIVSGIRAYNTRERLQYTQPKLMNYVKGGGTLIVQYNVNSELQVENIGPYPFTIGRGRVTVEQSPVNFIAPDHQLLNYPNKISQNDFEGWIQERGLYFAENWDSHYEPVLLARDPDEEELKGGMLFTRYGKGVFIYSAYSWFRQLPAGVPGAYRIFVNMLSAGKYENELSN